MARLSRYASGFAACPEPQDADIFLPWLKAEVERGCIDLVAPTSDLMAFYMAEFPECFPKGQMEAMADAEAIRTVLLKDRFDLACQKHDLKAPKTLSPTSVQEAHDLADSLTYPVILKPRSHVGVGWARGAVAHTSEMLRQLFRPYPLRANCQRVIERYPELAWPLLQEYVPRALEHLYSISGILSATGEVLAWAGSQKTRQWPPTLGIGVVFEPWQAQAPVAQGLKFVQAVLKKGIFELELIFDPRTSEYVAVDLNPRAHGHISFDIARHNNLPLMWHQLAKGQRLLPRPKAHGRRPVAAWRALPHRAPGGACARPQTYSPAGPLRPRSARHNSGHHSRDL